MSPKPYIRFNCEQCGRFFWVQPWRAASAQCCSMRCSNRFKGQFYREKIGDTQRGRGEGKAYTKYLGRHMHRVIAERKLGRPLRKGEIVHHKNENKKDNSACNIKVLPSQSAHVKLHRGKKGRFAVKKLPARLS